MKKQLENFIEESFIVWMLFGWALSIVLYAPFHFFTDRIIRNNWQSYLCAIGVILFVLFVLSWIIVLALIAYWESKKKIMDYYKILKEETEAEMKFVLERKCLFCYLIYDNDASFCSGCGKKVPKTKRE